MSLRRFTLLALFAPAFAWCVSATAAPLPVTSTPTAATVYADRAVVTRSGRVDLPSGQSELTFAALPASLLDASLQVNARGTPATILDVAARVAYLETAADPRIQTLEIELTALRRQDRVFKDELAALDRQRDLLAKIETAVTQPASKDATAPRPGFDEWQKLLTFSTDTTRRLAAERQALDQQRETLALKIASTEAQLNDLNGRPPARRATKTVTVRVSAAQPGPLDVTLAYALPGASWTPAYDVRLRSEARAVDLTYFGLVRNATGEDWNALALTLSTARPQLGGGAPELSPWIVDVIRRQQVSRKSVLMETAAPAMAKASADSYGIAEADQPASLALAVVDTAATSATFKIAVPATLPSDNAPQKVGITTARLPAVLRYDATPKERETAYLTAAVTNITDFPLLTGEASVFLDDTFVATSRLKTVMPKEKLDLALGADEGLAVTRKLVTRFTEDTGFTTKSKRVTYEFLLSVTNHKRTAERVVIQDATPVSRDEAIVVKLLAPAERDLLKPEDAAKLGVIRAADGKLTWRLDLKPGEKRELPVKFTVEHPADLNVIGLE